MGVDAVTALEVDRAGSVVKPGLASLFRPTLQPLSL